MLCQGPLYSARTSFVITSSLTCFQVGFRLRSEGLGVKAWTTFSDSLAPNRWVLELGSHCQIMVVGKWGWSPPCTHRAAACLAAGVGAGQEALSSPGAREQSLVPLGRLC